MGRLAYLFPGQGAQAVGMGRAFADAFPSARARFDAADAVLDAPLARLAFDGPADALQLTEHTQPAVLTASVAAWTVAREQGFPEPHFVAGHSLGEFSALVAAGVLGFEDAVRIVRARGRFMQEAVPVGVGAMAAVLALDVIQVAEACDEAVRERPGEAVVPANLNGPEQTVIAGHAGAVKLAGEKARAKGARRVLPLNVSAPFHSPLMQPVTPRLSELLDGTVFGDARAPVVTNVEAAPEVSGARLRALLVEQVTAPVRWTEVVARLVAEGVDTFVEFGPGSTLGALVKRQVAGARVVSVGDPAGLDAARAIVG